MSDCTRSEFCKKGGKHETDVVIIADSIVLTCPNVNANNSSNASLFVGITSDKFYIPLSEFEYLKDDNGNGLPDMFEDFHNWDKMLDTDGDRLPDSIEEYITTDKNLIDTDGDGLSDFYEVFATLTSPTNVDSDDNGIWDSDEDFDMDNLTNAEECIAGTDPRRADTDNDSLSDYDEYIIYHSNPLRTDTDNDGLSDSDEIYLQTDINNPDSNGNGILDGDEKFDQTFTHIVENDDCAVEEVIISMEGTGNLQNTMSVKSIMDTDLICSDVVGLVGEPFSIETTSKFEIATLSFKIDQAKLGDTDFNDLLFLWYDEDNYQFVELDTIYDEANSLVSIQTTHFSRYMVVDKFQWFEAWAVEFDYNPGAEGTHGEPNIYHNTVLTIDCSGSMDTNDRISIKSGIDSAYEALFPKTCQRIEAATEFIRNMNSIDKSAVVLFSDRASTAQVMTDNKEDLKLSLQKITSSGGTNFYAALTESYNAFEEDSIGAFYTENRIIFLSDGEDGSYSSTLSLLNSIYGKDSTDKRKSIKIYTIGLGSSYDSRLEEIANISHGEFFKAYTADDLLDIYTEIGIGGDFDTTDTDGDGLYDAVETAGIRIQNGQILKNDYDNNIIYTDPTKRDTDNDGLNDGEEIDPTIRWRNGSSNSGKKEYFFFMRSNPNNKDTDGDGLLDGKPQFKNGKPLAPADPEPSVYTGNKNLWKNHIEEISDNYNTSYGYSNDYYEVVEPEFELEFTDTLIPFPYFDNNLIEVLFSSVSTLGSIALDFRYDDNHIALHSDTTQWQAIGGYNDFYDWVFDTATSMNKLKLDFEANNKNYVIWAWKGNYLSLGAGSEVGFYTQNGTLESIEEFTGLEHWMIVDELPMTLSLYSVNNSGLVLDSYYHWLPDEEQWWITGFVPNIYDYSVKENELIQIASVDLSEFYDYSLHKNNVFNNLKSRYENDLIYAGNIIFDNDNQLLWLVW